MRSDENILDLIGWDLGKALAKLKKNDWQAIVSFTCPVKTQNLGQARVIRLTRVAEKKVAVIAARQSLSEGGDRKGGF